MEPSYIISLSDSLATLENAGGKGMSLAILTRAGLPVPGGFHVTTEAYRRFISANGLQEKILLAVLAADIAAPATLEMVSQSIGELFEHGLMPADISDAIVDAYQALGNHHVVVAVRSSATAEDLPEASFAGQQ